MWSDYKIFKNGKVQQLRVNQWTRIESGLTEEEHAFLDWGGALALRNSDYTIARIDTHQPPAVRDYNPANYRPQPQPRQLAEYASVELAELNRAWELRKVAR